MQKFRRATEINRCQVLQKNYVSWKSAKNHFFCPEDVILYRCQIAKHFRIFAEKQIRFLCSIVSILQKNLRVRFNTYKMLRRCQIVRKIHRSTEKVSSSMYICQLNFLEDSMNFPNRTFCVYEKLCLHIS